MRSGRGPRGGSGVRGALGGALSTIGALPPSTLLALGAASVLLLASLGLVVFTLSERGTGDRVAVVPTASPTNAVAVVTPSGTAIRTPTARAQATATRATPGRTTTATRGTATTAQGPLGSGRARAVRAIGGSNASAGERQVTPTPPPIAGRPTPTPTLSSVAGRPTPTPTTYRPPTSTPPPYRPTVYNTPTATTSYSSYSTPTPTPPSDFDDPDPTPTPAPTPQAPAPTPTPTPSPTAPAALPAVTLPAADARPFRYELEYSRNGDLGGIPPSEYVYTLTWRSYSRADVDALKAALGLKGPVEETVDGFRVADPGTLTVSNAGGGLIRYTAPATGATATPAPSPARGVTATRGTSGATRTPVSGLTDDAALAAARSWLGQKGLPLPPNANAGRVTRPVVGQVVVTFNPQQPDGPILGDPAVVVTLDAATGAVREVSYRWPGGSTAPTLLRLRPVADAWADVQAGKGYAEVESPVPANVPPGTVYRGTARATKVRAGWTLATATDGTSYLLPVYVFEGEATLEGQSRPVPFRVFVPALP